MLPNDLADLPIDDIAQFMAGLQMRLLDWWLVKGAGYTADEIAAMLYRTMYRRNAPPLPEHL